MKIETPKQLAENISQFVNGTGTGKNEEFLTAMANEHRTLQQAFTRLCLQWIEHMASLPDSQIDMRNGMSVEVARTMIYNAAVAEAYGDKPSKALPTI